MTQVTQCDSNKCQKSELINTILQQKNVVNGIMLQRVQLEQRSNTTIDNK